MNPWPWLAGIMILLAAGNVVQHFELAAKEADLDKVTADKDTAVKNQLSNGKSAAAWEIETTKANERTAACQMAAETNRQENAKALADVAKAADSANAKLAAYTARLNKARNGTCSALLAMPICAEALPNE